MDLTVLGRKRTGYNYFSLTSPDSLGYDIIIVNLDSTEKYYNVLIIEWLTNGRKVYLQPFKGKEYGSLENLNLSVSITIKKSKIKNNITFKFERNET